MTGKTLTVREVANALHDAEYAEQIMFTFCNMDVIGYEQAPGKMILKAAPSAGCVLNARGVRDIFKKAAVDDADVWVETVGSHTRTPVVDVYKTHKGFTLHTGVTLGFKKQIETQMAPAPDNPNGCQESAEEKNVGLTAAAGPKTPVELNIGLANSRITGSWLIVVHGNLIGRIGWAPDGYRCTLDKSNVIPAYSINWNKMVKQLSLFLINEVKYHTSRIGEKHD